MIELNFLVSLIIKFNDQFIFSVHQIADIITQVILIVMPRLT